MWESEQGKARIEKRSEASMMCCRNGVVSVSRPRGSLSSYMHAMRNSARLMRQQLKRRAERRAERARRCKSSSLGFSSYK
jgi:hypothetical protein